jgi:hypothetical protein
VLFLGGVQLLCLGLFGEYLGRLYASVQGRPAYFIGYDSADELTPAGAASPNGHTTAGRYAPTDTAVPL